MPRPLHATIYLAIATFLLALVLRTWLAMGWIAPVMVAGSSMAPALRGPFATVTCPNCETRFDVGAEFASQTEYAACPHCGLARVRLASSPLHRGERLWIDRTLFSRRKPKRWEVVVLRQPSDGRQLAIKRVVGLPGETVRISAGDVWVNGRVAVKPIEKQLAVCQLISRSGKPHGPWKSEPENSWNFSEGSWRHALNNRKDVAWLSYQLKDRQTVTDNVAYNAGLSRRLNRVQDFMLAARLHAAGEGQLVIRLDDGFQSFDVTLAPSTGEIELSEKGKPLSSSLLSATACRRLRRESIPLVLSNFDRQLLLILDGEVVFRRKLDAESSPQGSGRPVAIGAQGLEVSLDGLTLSRDIYYTSAPPGAQRPKSGASVQRDGSIRLGEGQYFLLGDNSPISVDSRFWGPVPGRLLLGGPIGVR